MISFYLKQKFNLNLGHKVVLRYLNNLNLHTRRINLRDYDDEYRKEHLMPKIKNLLLDENGKPDFSVKHKNEK
ncbi:hypothetical protein FACS1894218_1610 [Bacilli bacterium]|nr:hypothetical protein FACS1894218_1610 [Bacilli bacterium]